MSRFVVIMMAAVTVLLGIIFFQGRDGTVLGEVSNYTVGKGTSGVTLTEFGDFQCPACGAFHPVIQQVKEKYGDQITFRFQHFPLVQIHPNAMAAHRAAESAGRQNKFFEMHDLLYEGQQSWTSSNNVKQVFEGYAEQLALNMDQYRADAESSSVLGVINADIKAGQDVGVTSTPTFLLDGKKIESPRDLEDFFRIIDEAIAAKKTASAPTN